jgi:hypothetical protein
LETLQVRAYFENLGVDGKIILELILGKWNGRVWIGCIYFRIRTSGGLL